MLARLTAAFLLAALPLGAQQQEEHRKIPKDSIEVTATGCLTGRAFKVDDIRQTDVQSGPIIRQRAFRLAGKKDVMTQVKEADGQFVEVTGLLQKNALREPGMRFKGGRVVVGSGRIGGGAGIPDPAENTVVMDVSAVRVVGGACR